MRVTHVYPHSIKQQVGAAGLEPARLAARDFKSPASANSATPPRCFKSSSFFAMPNTLVFYTPILNKAVSRY